MKESKEEVEYQLSVEERKKAAKAHMEASTKKMNGELPENPIGNIVGAAKLKKK